MEVMVFENNLYSRPGIVMEIRNIVLFVVETS